MWRLIIRGRVLHSKYPAKDLGRLLFNLVLYRYYCHWSSATTGTEARRVHRAARARCLHLGPVDLRPPVLGLSQWAFMPVR
ncbi:hypothetical protein FIBSPDRAFT_876518 [Athelia psychrophila]|uniref:Uncharacterized protein n=1 Tax=Athelia psychrophila TaxID=1759441 RepID=A0A167WTQ5_9AGAM|nr:hypothetical protein FIBSPDRAFT_876518 [Fibularhizoctonia sp. CBS 109695]